MPEADPAAAPVAAPVSPTLPSRSGYLAALLRRRDPLLPRVMDFLQYPGRYTHPSWAPPEWGNLRRLSGPRAEARLGRALLEAAGLPAGTDIAFRHPGHRLALADGAALERAAFLGGLAVLSSEIAQVLERDRVLALRADLGVDDYRFALHKAPFLAGATLAQAYRPREGSWRERSRRAGLRLLGGCFPGAPAGLMARLKLKLPRAFAREIDAGAEAGGDLSRLFRKLLLEVDPAWTVLFS